MHRYEPVTWTGRKLQAFMQREQRQRRKVDQDFPLLGAALLVEPAPTPNPDAELAARRARSAATEKSMRDLTTKHWRKGRAQYQACDVQTQEAIRCAWAAWTGPANASMFIYVVEKHSGEAERRRQEIRARDAELRQQVRVGTPAQGQLNV